MLPNFSGFGRGRMRENSCNVAGTCLWTVSAQLLVAVILLLSLLSTMIFTYDSHLRLVFSHYADFNFPAPILGERGPALFASHSSNNAAIVIHWHWRKGV